MNFDEFKENFEKELKLEVEAHVTIPEETAYRCVELLNLYLTDNPNKSLTLEEFDGKRFLCWRIDNEVGGEKE